MVPTAVLGEPTDATFPTSVRYTSNVSLPSLTKSVRVRTLNVAAILPLGIVTHPSQSRSSDGDAGDAAPTRTPRMPYFTCASRELSPSIDTRNNTSSPSVASASSTASPSSSTASIDTSGVSSSTIFTSIRTGASSQSSQ